MLNVIVREFFTTEAITHLINEIASSKRLSVQDGGPGFGGLAMLLLGLIIVTLIGIKLYKGIKQDNEYFVIAGIHIVLLAGGLYSFFL